MQNRVLWLEWAALFVAFPVLAFMEWLPVSKFLVFGVPVLYALLVYRLSRQGSKPDAASPRRSVSLQQLPIVRIIALSVLLVLLARLMLGNGWFGLPRYRPELWLLIMCLYPLVSALPQEFLYRRFYMWRYARLFPAGESSGNAMLLSNAVLFSLLHLMYDNALALIVTFIGGALFAWSYQRSGRLRWVWLEHAVYGQVIFTSGLGRYFYEPTPSL